MINLHMHNYYFSYNRYWKPEEESIITRYFAHRIATIDFLPLSQRWFVDSTLTNCNNPSALGASGSSTYSYIRAVRLSADWYSYYNYESYETFQFLYGCYHYHKPRSHTWLYKAFFQHPLIKCIDSFLFYLWLFSHSSRVYLNLVSILCNNLTVNPDLNEIIRQHLMYPKVVVINRLYLQ